MEIGIDFGTTNSYIAILDGQDIKMATTQDGRSVFPSKITYQEDQLMSIKRFLGRTPEELDSLGLPYVIDNNQALVSWAGKTFKPEELAGGVFRKILSEASVSSSPSAILAVPAHYDEAQRRATQRAAQNAGVDVVRLIHEPTAAALSFTDAGRVLVFDLGGGTLDISLLEAEGGVFEVLKTFGNRNLGGDDLDLLLAVEIAKRLELPFSKELLLEAQSIKHALSSKSFEKTTFLDKQLEISRDDFEEIAAPFLSEIKNALDEFDLQGEFDQLFLVGGMAKMPAVVTLVEEYYSAKAEVSKDPEFAVARGAARYLSSLKGDSDTLLLDITPMSFGIEVDQEKYSVIVPAGSRIPFSFERLFSTSYKNQSSVEINILQGESKDSSENRQLGRIWLRGIDPAPAGVPEIWVLFEIDASGMLSVFVTEGSKKEELIIDLAAGDL